MNAEKKIPKLFLAEIADELTGFLDHCKNTGLDPSDFLVVSLEPEVKVLCKEKGLKDIDTLPFFNTASHKRVLEKSHRLTTLIAENLSFHVESSVEKLFLHTFIFYSRFYINNFLWTIEILKGLKQEYRDFEAVVFSRDTGSTAAARLNPYMIKRDQFVASLTEKYCKANRLGIDVIYPPPRDAQEIEKGRDTRTKTIMKILARTVFKMKLKKYSRFPSVFTTVPSYNLDRVCRDIQERFPGVLAVTDLRGAISTRGYLRLFIKESIKLVTKRAPGKQLLSVPVDLFIRKDPVVKAEMSERLAETYREFFSLYQKEFEYESCSFWDEFNRKVETDLLHTLARIYETAAGQRAFLRYLRPALLLSPVSTADAHSWAREARSLDIPTLVIPQKTLLVPSDPNARIEERYIGSAQVSDTFENAAAQSPLIHQYLKWSGFKGNIIETGNLLFARLDLLKRKERRSDFFEEIGAPPETRVIVWAPSMKTRRSRRFFVLESIDELTSAMEDVFDVVSRMEDVHLIFRIHPGDAITKEEIYKLLSVPSNVSVSNSGDFEDVLAAADLLLSFSSTAVQEALINFIPVLFYDKWNRYNHLDAAGVEGPTPSNIAAAYYIHEKDRLDQSIRWILDRHTGEKIPRELFKDYVFTGDSSPGFFDFVEQCLKSKERV